MFFWRQKVEMNSQSCIIFCSFFETLCFICLNRFCHHRLFVFFFSPSRLRFFVSFRIFLSLHCLSSCVHVGVCSPYIPAPPALPHPTQTPVLSPLCVWPVLGQVPNLSTRSKVSVFKGLRRRSQRKPGDWGKARVGSTCKVGARWR